MRNFLLKSSKRILTNTERNILFRKFHGLFYLNRISDNWAPGPCLMETIPFVPLFQV